MSVYHRSAIMTLFCIAAFVTNSFSERPGVNTIPIIA